MKRYLLIAGLAFATATHVDAQVAKSPVWNHAVNNTAKIAPSFQDVKPYMNLAPYLIGETKGEQKNALTLNRLWLAGPNVYFETHNENNIFDWDPATGNLFITQSLQTFGGDNGRWDGGVQRVFAYRQGLTMLDTVLVNTQTGFWSAFPAFALTEFSGVTNPRQMSMYIATVDYSVASSGSRSSNSAVIRDGNGLYSLIVEGPANNNPNGGYNFSTVGSAVPTDGANGNRVTYVSTLGLASQNSPVQLGAFGTYSFDFNAGDVELSSNAIPATWTAASFRQPPGALDRTFVGGVYADKDSEGNLYAAACSPLASDASAGDRTPIVSTSTNGGRTWSAWNKCPVSVLQAYASEQGWQGFGHWRPYDEDDFVVTGVDRYSYFFRLGAVAGNNFSGDVHLVEAEYNNGQWTLRKIADINDVPIVFNRSRTAPDDNTWPLEWDFNSRGNCIDVAKTADGAKVAVIWLDGNPRRGYRKFTRFEAFQVESGTAVSTTPTAFDSLLVSDIFFAERSLAGGTWSTRNLTDDDQMETSCKMPRTIPSTTEATPVYVATVFPLENIRADYPFLPALRNLPTPLYQSQVGILTTSNFATSIPVSVNETSTPAPMAIAAVSPNPTVSGAEVTWSLERSGVVYVRVVDMLGNTAQTITNGFVEAGTHAFNVNTSSMASGTYNVVIGMEGRTVTSPIVVVR
jgi:hypothetical protein